MICRQCHHISHMINSNPRIPIPTLLKIRLFHHHHPPNLPHLILIPLLINLHPNHSPLFILAHPYQRRHPTRPRQRPQQHIPSPMMRLQPQLIDPHLLQICYGKYARRVRGWHEC